MRRGSRPGRIPCTRSRTPTSRARSCAAWCCRARSRAAFHPLRARRGPGAPEIAALHGLCGRARRAVSAALRSGGRLLADQLALHDVELAFCVPARATWRCSTASTRTVDAARRHVPPRGGGRERRRRVRQADRSAGHLHGHARPGRDARLDRRAHGDAGLHAAPAAGRPGAALPSRPRGLSGDRLRAAVRRRREVGLRDRPGRADPRDRRARLRDRVAGRPGPVVLALPEDVLAATTDAADAVPVPRVARRRRRRPRAHARVLAAAERPLAIVGGSGWTPSRRRLARS